MNDHTARTSDDTEPADGPNFTKTTPAEEIAPGPDLAPERPPLPGARSTVGVLAVVVAFLVLLAGMFVLPLNTYPFPGSDIGFVEIRSFTALVSDRPDTGSFQPFSTLGEFWWRFGVLIVVVVLAVLVLVTIGATDRRPFGWVITVLAVLGGVLHGLALAQSTDLRSGAQFLVGYGQTNIYDHAGSGVWVSLAGFGLLAVAGIVTALLSPRSVSPRPISPRPVPA